MARWQAVEALLPHRFTLWPWYNSSLTQTVRPRLIHSKGYTLTRVGFAKTSAVEGPLLLDTDAKKVSNMTKKNSPSIMPVANLNEASFEVSLYDRFKGKYSTSSGLDRNNQPNDVSADISIRFFEIDTFIAEKIRLGGACVGCAPWFNAQTAAFKALNDLQLFSIVSSSDQKSQLVKGGKFPYSVLTCAESLSRSDAKINSDANISSIEYVSVIKSENRFFARNHNKFFVIGEIKENKFIPKEVITGSCNLTENAALSLENVVYIKSEQIASAYLMQWYSVLMVALYQRDKSLIVAGGRFKEMMDYDDQTLEEDASAHEFQLSRDIPDDDM
jgi:hypothetical protein